MKLIIIFVVLNQMSNMTNLKKYPISILSPKGLSAVSIGQPFNNAKSGNFIMEIWKDIKGYEGLYQVSNLSRVKSFVAIKYKNANYNKEHIKKQSIGKRGYYAISVRKNGKLKLLTVHRLIAFAFIPNPKDKPYINHKDGNKLNNDISNLEWATSSENNLHAYKTGLKYVSEYQKNKTSLMNRGSNQHNSKLKEHDISGIRRLNKTIKGKEIAKIYNVSKSTISQIISGKTWKHV